jgi:superfamily II DNA/RNA helicase
MVQVHAPEDQVMCIHRIGGRTARYKSKGNSLLLLDPPLDPSRKKHLSDQHFLGDATSGIGSGSKCQTPYTAAQEGLLQSCSFVGAPTQVGL